MASISDEQREQVNALLRQGQLSREDIATRVGVSPGTVSAIKANLTRGAYPNLAGLGTSEAETDELIEASEATFGLERDLQRALRSNIQQIESGLQIIDDGKEQTTEAGRIDITAKDGNDVIVVIELKAGKAEPEALTQLLAYMGVIGKQEQKPVRGILIAGDFHPRVVFAAHAVTNVQLRRYRFAFTFEAIE
jgi:transcriptional regulator with XRE-family HTH domain